MKTSIATLALIQGLALATPMGTRTSRSVARIAQRNAAPTTTGAAPTNPAEVPDTAISHNKESGRGGSGNKLADDELADDEITDNDSWEYSSTKHSGSVWSATDTKYDGSGTPPRVMVFRGIHPHLRNKPEKPGRYYYGEDTDDEVPELPYDEETDDTTSKDGAGALIQKLPKPNRAGASSKDSGRS